MFDIVGEEFSSKDQEAVVGARYFYYRTFIIRSTFQKAED
jgi:hypothetical protein